ncbi:SIN1-domain-containing protein [Wolfiporia cocos MD-104 SS10]|uniref:SIN1-domain-containing protein n=1 Tax=Wolfiporia cocos (strain MD-104) TaxID=742152 RepID=A0A2H3K1H0_WOLCO|nr:SIN1-domain-containing protein [Wolfiporia cocos MD-104 SS10]
MSLISDPDYLIHSLRLNYLRHVEDPFGSRLITLDPAYDSNPYIVASGLADANKWPELNEPSSPAPSDDEKGPGGRFNARFPGGAAGLKYTTTIMGPSRVGAMGMSVSRKRTSVNRHSYRFSIRSEGELAKPEPDGDAPTNTETILAAPASAPSAKPANLTSPEKAAPIASASSADAATPAPVRDSDAQPKVASPEFRPKFKGAAEMEARRKLRMLARAQPPGVVSRPPPRGANLNPDWSSSDSESELDDGDAMPEEDEDDFDLIAGADGSIDMEGDGDEFDPEFAASRGLSSGLDMHSDSDGVSLMSGSNSVMSTSASSMAMAGASVPAGSSSRVRNRLSPVREGRNSEEKSDSALPERPEESAPIELGFDMVIPAPKAEKHKQTSASTPAPPALSNPHAAASTPPDDLFARRPIAPMRPAKSALTAMLADAGPEDASSNPFTELYSAISGRSEGESMAVNVFFPLAREPDGQALKLSVRKDATVEEVLGFALWSYWEEGWLPKIDEELKGEDDPQWEIRCSAVGWILRIAEDDGEVDEDFPPLDRSSKISKFKFDAYAVLAANSTQVQQNKVLEAKIQRRLSRIVIKKKKSTGLFNPPGAAMTLAPPVDSFAGTSVNFSSLASSVPMFSGSLGPSSSHGPPQFLRIRIADTADAGHVSTTIPASSGMYMAEVLEAICQKRKLSNPKDYALVLDIGATKVNIPLDRTVKSLQGKRDLILMKKSMLQSYGVEMSTGSGRTTDPNASIFKRNSESLEPSFNTVLDYTNAYRKYTVYRKLPMLVTRSARLLAIDGGYIHIMPVASKAKHVFESGGKTSSYHLKSVVQCQQSSKNSATFKLIVHSGADRNKRYDFEAESSKLAAEIVQTIRALKASIERPGTLRQSRRSRHGN